MKLTKVLRGSASLYKKNFRELLTALVIELALRAMCLAPLLFLLSPEMAAGAWVCVPLYLLVVLPARQNVAIAMQDLIATGRMNCLLLVDMSGYGRKLLRGLMGFVKMLLWSLPAIASLGTLVAIYYGVLGDGFTALRYIAQLGGGSIVNGTVNALLIVAALLVLPIVGCAVHSGCRHAWALGSGKLLRGNRARLTVLWFIGLSLLLPFAAVLLVTAGDWAVAFVGQLKNSLMSGIVLEPLGSRLYVIVAAAVLLVLPVLPLRTLLPAVYLSMAKENADAQA